MTLKEAAQQALEVLDDFVDDPRCQKQIDDAITALRQALANDAMDKIAENERELGIQMQADEPVALMGESTCSETLRIQGKPYPRTCKKCGLGPCIGKPVTQREWVGLTLDEIDLLEELYAPPVHPDFVNDKSHCLELIRHVEAKLKEKNHG